MVFMILGIISCIHVLFRARTSHGAIAWGISLICLPKLALPLYWVLGRDRFQGYVKLSRAASYLKSHAKEVEDFLSGMRSYRSEKLSGVPEALSTFEAMADVPCSDGNDILLLEDGEAIFSTLFQEIEKARAYILVSFFILRGDDTGSLLKDKLLKKAEEGVKVYVLYDRLGSLRLPNRHVREMRDAGVEIYPFTSTPRRGVFSQLQVNFRNHRKIVVVDGETGFVGGSNIGVEYYGKKGHWRETHLCLKGPAVKGLQLTFLEDFHWAVGKIPKKLLWTVPASNCGDQTAVFIPTGPSDERNEGLLFFLQSIHAAERRLWMASPYFIPDPAVKEALKLAALRGVDVRIIIPKRTDILVCHLAAFAYFYEFEKTGVKFFRYNAGQAHQKVCLIDDKFAWVGSSNWDTRSMRLNFEGNLLVADKAFCTEIEEMLLKDQSKSEVFCFKDRRRDRFLFSGAVAFARLFSPIL